MFYFTRNFPPEAVYSGRFAFVANIHPHDAQSRIDAAWASTATGVVNDSMTEEVRHARLFLRSYTGLTLSGLRLIARLSWMCSRVQAPIRFYYRLRSLFYAIAYGAHENVVRLTNDEQCTEVVRQADEEILSRWIRNGGPWAVVVVLASPILALCGYLLARGVTIITIEWVGSALRERNHSISGILNQLGPVRTSNPNGVQMLAIRVLNGIRPEQIRPCSFADDLSWLRAKVAVESQHYEALLANLRGHESVDWLPNRYPEYLQILMSFVCRWIPGERDEDTARIAAVVGFALSNNNVPVRAQADLVIRKLVSFYYLHGN